jgi:hypothetical protein
MAQVISLTSYIEDGFCNICNVADKHNNHAFSKIHKFNLMKQYYYENPSVEQTDRQIYTNNTTCTLCNINCSINIDTHFSSKQHHLNVLNTFYLQQTNKLASATSSTCCLCNITITDMQEHVINSETHAWNVLQNNPEINYRDGKCIVCNIDINGMSAMVPHSDGQQHLSNLARNHYYTYFIE